MTRPARVRPATGQRISQAGQHCFQPVAYCVTTAIFQPSRVAAINPDKSEFHVSRRLAREMVRSGFWAWWDNSYKQIYRTKNRATWEVAQSGVAGPLVLQADPVRNAEYA